MSASLHNLRMAGGVFGNNTLTLKSPPGEGTNQIVHFVTRGALFVKHDNDVQANWQRVVRRRSFLGGLGVAGAASLPAGRLFAQTGNRLTTGDAALLRFAAAIEFIEADL